MDQYRVLDLVGKGSFGVVRKIQRRSDGRILVWKELNYGSMSDKEKQLVVSRSIYCENCATRIYFVTMTG